MLSDGLQCLWHDNDWTASLVVTLALCYFSNTFVFLHKKAASRVRRQVRYVTIASYFNREHNVPMQSAFGYNVLPATAVHKVLYSLLSQWSSYPVNECSITVQHLPTSDAMAYIQMLPFLVAMRSNESTPYTLALLTLEFIRHPRDARLVLRRYLEALQESLPSDEEVFASIVEYSVTTFEYSLILPCRNDQSVSWKLFHTRCALPCTTWLLTEAAPLWVDHTPISRLCFLVGKAPDSTTARRVAITEPMRPMRIHPSHLVCDRGDLLMYLDQKHAPTCWIVTILTMIYFTPVMFLIEKYNSRIAAYVRQTVRLYARMRHATTRPEMTRLETLIERLPAEVALMMKDMQADKSKNYEFATEGYFATLQSRLAVDEGKAEAAAHATHIFNTLKGSVWHAMLLALIYIGCHGSVPTFANYVFLTDEDVELDKKLLRAIHRTRAIRTITVYPRKNMEAAETTRFIYDVVEAFDKNTMACRHLPVAFTIRVYSQTYDAGHLMAIIYSHGAWRICNSWGKEPIVLERDGDIFGAIFQDNKYEFYQIVALLMHIDLLDKQQRCEFETVQSRSGEARVFKAEENQDAFVDFKSEDGSTS